MATRLYFHAASSGLSNLPTTEQSTLTATVNSDALTVNRSMDTSIGTSQASFVLNSSATSSAQNLYYSRFVSPALNMASLPAQTWTYNFSCQVSNTFANFPVTNSNQPIPICCYVWRPGTGKVANVLNGNSASVYNELSTNNTNLAMHGTFSGAAVNSMQSGDVLVFEMWHTISQANNTARTTTMYYDGTTVNTSMNTTSTSHASFLESPQDFTFDGGGSPTSMTPNGITGVRAKPITVV